jgi:nitronate monooxygenase
VGEATWDDDGFDGKVAALLAGPAPAVSFTFGCPPAEVISALQHAGSIVVITVTSPGEAAAAAGAGDTERMSLFCRAGLPVSGRAARRRDHRAAVR